MKKNDIIAVYAEKNNVTKKAATEVVGSVIDIIKDGILTEGVVDITGFVKLEKVYKEATTARNPQTGESIAVPSKYIPKAKFSSTFKREVNELDHQSKVFKNISVIGHYEDIEPIIKELARYDDVYFISLEIGLSGVIDYDDEYILSINNDYEVFVEPAKRNGKYFNYDSEVLYIFSDCSSKLIHCNLNKNTEVYEVDYADEVEEDYEDELIDDIDDGKYVVVKSNLSDDEIKDLLGRVRDNLNHMDECFAEMDRIREIFGW